LDGTLSSDPDDDPLNYRWYLSTTETLLDTGVVSIVSLPAGRHPIELVVDDGLATATNSFTLQVFTAAESLGQLIITVHESRWSRSQSLLASLNAALASVERANLIPAVNQLEAFQSKVMVQVAPTAPDLAAQFAGGAQAIIEAIKSCDASSGQNHPHLRATSFERGRKLEFEGVAGCVYVIEASSDMVHWEKIGAAKAKGSGRFEFIDPNTGKFAHRFYRVVTP